MTGFEKQDRWLKRIDTSVIKPLLVLLLVVIGRDAGAEYTITLSEIAESFDGHSTTRTTVRRVFHHDGYWYVFCGDVRNKVYCNTRAIRVLPFK